MGNGVSNSTVDNILLHNLQSSVDEGHSLFECNATLWFFNEYGSVTNPPFADAIVLVSSNINETDSVFSSQSWIAATTPVISIQPNWGPEDGAYITIEKCFARPYRDRCAVYLNTTSSAIVISCNALKLVCILLCLFISNHTPLMTIGDAISAFLRTETEVSRAPSSSLTAEHVTDDSERQQARHFSANMRSISSRWRFWLCAPRIISWTLPSAV